MLPITSNIIRIFDSNLVFSRPEFIVLFVNC